MSSVEEDDLNFTTPSSEGLETLSSDDESIELIQPLSPFSMPLKARFSPQRSNSLNASFGKGGTAITSNMLAVLSSYRKPRGGGGGGGGRGGGMATPLSDTLPGLHQSRSMGTFVSSRDTSHRDASQLALGDMDTNEESIRPIQGFLGVRSGAFSNSDTGREGGESSGDLHSGDVCSNGEMTTAARCTLNSGTFKHSSSTRIGGGNIASLRPFSDGDSQFRKESQASSRDTSRDKMGNSVRSPRVLPGSGLPLNESFVGLRHKASTIPAKEQSFVVSASMSKNEIRIAEVIHHKQQQKDEARKALLMRFLGGGGAGVVGD